MIAVQTTHRKLGLGTILATRAIESLRVAGADEVALETEEINTAALKLYQKLGFLRTKHLKRYYLNGNDAFELVMYLNDTPVQADAGGRDSGDDWDDDEYL
jgi:N-alpha-acetyltransferase 30